MTREHIIRIAFEHFLSEGYETTSMNDLVSASGVSKGAFYHYFASKEDLLKATLESFFLNYFPKQPPSLLPTLEAALEVVWHPYATLFTVVTECTHDVLDYYRYLFTGMHYFPKLRTQLSTINQQTQTYLETVFERARIAGDIRSSIQPAIAAAQFIRLIEGTGLLIALENSAAEEILRIQTESFLNTLR